MPSLSLTKTSLAPLGAVLLALSPALLTGCGGAGKNKNAVVSGKVTYKGQPVTGGTIKFVPADNGPPSLGPIKPDGTFSFGGVPLGNMHVAIETESIRNAARMDYTRSGKAPPGTNLPQSSGDKPVYVHLPAKYADPAKSGLTWEINKSNASKDFDLQ